MSASQVVRSPSDKIYPTLVRLGISTFLGLGPIKYKTASIYSDDTLIHDVLNDRCFHVYSMITTKESIEEPELLNLAELDNPGNLSIVELFTETIWSTFMKHFEFSWNNEQVIELSKLLQKLHRFSELPNRLSNLLWRFWHFSKSNYNNILTQNDVKKINHTTEFYPQDTTTLISNMFNYAERETYHQWRFWAFSRKQETSPIPYDFDQIKQKNSFVIIDIINEDQQQAATRTSISSSPNGLDATCRICCESYEPLVQPCACRGTISAVHLQCLRGWVKSPYARRHAYSCELCGEKYAIPFRYDLHSPPVRFMIKRLNCKWVEPCAESLRKLPLRVIVVSLLLIFSVSLMAISISLLI